MGDLLRRANHLAIIVEDVGRSLAWYSDIIGFQQVWRPNFDRHGESLLNRCAGSPLIQAANPGHNRVLAFCEAIFGGSLYPFSPYTGISRPHDEHSQNVKGRAAGLASQFKLEASFFETS